MQGVFSFFLKSLQEPPTTPANPSISSHFNALAFRPRLQNNSEVPVEIPNTPKTLSAEEVTELDKQLAQMRHDINNHLSLVTAAVEIMRLKPETAERMIENIAKQPNRIMSSMQDFTKEFDQQFGITRD